MENERTGGRAGGKRIDGRAEFGALRNGIAACVVAIHCVRALYTAFPTTASVAGEVKGHFISPHNGIHTIYNTRPWENTGSRDFIHVQSKISRQQIASAKSLT